MNRSLSAFTNNFQPDEEHHNSHLLLRRVFRSASDELRDYKSRRVPARLVTASPAETLR